MATRHTLSLALLAWGIALPRMNADSFQIMHDFGGSPSGTEPLAGLIRDAAGNLYGTAEYGGDDNSGVVFRISPAGKYTLLHAFHGTDGAAPVAGLVEDQAGNLYGAASLGGRSHHGVIFKIDAAGAYSVLHNFTGADGSSPQDALILDSAGNLYGATVEGGASGKGVVFKLDTSGNETVLYSFTGGADGSEPHASLIQDSAGNLYGTAAKGGAADKGVVFMLDASGQETVLHSFTAAHTDGAKPLACCATPPATCLARHPKAAPTPAKDSPSAALCSRSIQAARRPCFTTSATTPAATHPWVILFWTRRAIFTAWRWRPATRDVRKF